MRPARRRGRDAETSADVRTDRELGLDVPVRGDHVPEMEGDRLLSQDCLLGYFTLGRLFVNGYLTSLVGRCG